jgi:hypothetical protein
VEAGDHNNSVLLHLKENAVRKPSYSRSSSAPMNDRELQRSLGDGLYRSLDCDCKALAKFQSNFVIPRPRLPKFRGGLGHPEYG